MSCRKAVTTELRSPTETHLTSNGRPVFRKRYLLLVLAILLSSTYHWSREAHIFILPTDRCEEDNTTRTAADFNWETLRSSTSLQYSNCHEDYQCARLILPMDYWNDTTNATVTLALIRKPALVPVTHPRYGGAVVMNPGGPGGHGVPFLLSVGEQISSLLSPSDEDDGGKFFDLISFDPRGVGYSTPKLACFQGDTTSEQAWNLRNWEQGSLGASAVAFGQLWAMSKARAGSCAIISEEPDIKRYATTAYVARDILEIVEKHGEWREKEATRLSTSHSHETHEVYKHQSGQEKLLYWGFSYGTNIGSTFAAMFPDRVERLVLDGVVDAIDNLQIAWFTDLSDTEKTMSSFYRYCTDAGYPACLLASPDSKTDSVHVKQRTLAIIENIRDDPVTVIGLHPEVITVHDLRMLIFLSLYKPVQMFPILARTLAELEKGDGSNSARMLRPYHDLRCRAAPYVNHMFDNDAQLAITCSDGDDQTWMNRTEFANFAEQLIDISPSIGDVWAALRMYCIHYPLRPQHRYTGPWEVTPAHPILFIGNTMDPVTPAINAYKMANRFKNSVVLLQDSAGHSSLAAYSKCTTQYVRGYFQIGHLPVANTTCQPDEIPFGLEAGAIRTTAHTQYMDIGEAFMKYGLGMHIQHDI
jgi:pimeloyl-ACP methyl ester carboxylesterase